MKNGLFCICVVSCVVFLAAGCGRTDLVKTQEGQYVVYDYSQENVSNFKAASTATDNKIPDQDKYLKIYESRHGSQRAVASTAKPKQPVKPVLAKPEDIAAAKKIIPELKGSLGYGPNRAITSVKLSSTGDSIPLDVLQLIGRLADLESITFEGAAFNDEMLAQLKELKRVHTLSISNANITAATLEMLTTWPELKTLELRRDMKLDNASLAILQKMPKLEELSVLYNAFTNSGMARIAKVKTLKSVDARGCPDVSDNGAKYLARLPEVKELFFRGLITNQGVENLTAAPKLAFVEFQDCNDLEVGSVESFKKMPVLKGLRLFRCKSVDDKMIAGLAELKWERLELRDLNLSNAALTPLKNQKTLKILELSELPSVNTAGLLDLVSALSGLDELNFFFIPLDDAGLAKIVENMPGLKKLTVRAVAMTDAGIDSLLKLQKLETLDIRENSGLTAAALAKLSGVKSLRRLYVSGTCLTQKENESVLKGLRSALPKCQVID